MSYSLKPWLVFDAKGDLGLIPSTRRWSLIAGFTIITVRLWNTASR